jgi:hypothetical protein
MGPEHANLPEEFKKGERLSASKLNQLVQALAGLLRSKYGFGVHRPAEISGKLDGDLVKATSYSTTPGTATMSVWQKNSSGVMVDSGRNETVVTRLQNITTITSGTIVYAMWVDGEWVVFMADC